MSPSYTAISFIKQSNMTREQITIFLLNESKEDLFDYLMESKILSNSTRISKTKVIELIITDGVITVDKEINILPINTEKMRRSSK